MSSTAISTLETQLQGDVLFPGHPEYDEQRKIWNGIFDRHPRYICMCESEDDVVYSVNFARESGMLLAVRGGGHNSAGTGSCDDGLVVDLSRMNRVVVEPDKGKVSVQGGCLLGDVDAATIEHGLAVPSGIVSHTGVGGITLGGGFGWISRKFGLSVDNLLSAMVVTADGQLVKASEDENPDLFWGLKGGGGNFGVVTEFTFRTVEIGKQVFSGVIVKKFNEAEEYIRFHSRFVPELPDEMTVWMVIRKVPPLPFVPEEYHGQLAILVPFCYVGPQDEGDQLIQPIRDVGETLADGSAMHDWTAWQSAFDALNSHGARNYWKSHQMREMPEECIEKVIKYSAKLPTDECEVVLAQMGGEVARLGKEHPNATAFVHRSAPFVLNIHTRWREPEDDKRCKKWAQEIYDATSPFSEGVYVNFISEPGKDKAKLAYGHETYKRLGEVKRRWDPNNFFRVNINIEP